jgi:hypothetical protein
VVTKEQSTSESLANAKDISSSITRCTSSSAGLLTVFDWLVGDIVSRMSGWTEARHGTGEQRTQSRKNSQVRILCKNAAASAANCVI